MSHFQPHQDMINSLEMFERNERLLIVSASSDCSVALCDIYGNKIGTFGQVMSLALKPLRSPCSCLTGSRWGRGGAVLDGCGHVFAEKHLYMQNLGLLWMDLLSFSGEMAT